jgi:hypothetical protein
MHAAKLKAAACVIADPLQYSDTYRRGHELPQHSTSWSVILAKKHGTTWRSLQVIFLVLQDCKVPCVRMQQHLSPLDTVDTADVHTLHSSCSLTLVYHVSFDPLLSSPSEKDTQLQLPVPVNLNQGAWG